jgi:hypothetical protein
MGYSINMFAHVATIAPDVLARAVRRSGLVFPVVTLLRVSPRIGNIAACNPRFSPSATKA